MLQNTVFELSFPAAAPAGNEAQPDLTAVFTHEGQLITVKGFYDGEGQYKVRFLPEQPGECRWQVSGIVSATGCDTCLPAPDAHGRVRAEGVHFEYADGTLFWPFGTTVYALIHQPDELVEQTLQTLAASPFNKVRLCLFPKHFAYNENEPPFYPFEKKEGGGWDVRRPCLAYWHRLEAILDRLARLHIEADIILFHPYDNWGFAEMPQEDNLIYLDTVIRRLAAYPGIWWSLANEYDVCGAKSLDDWYGIEAFVSENDPFRHLLSNHHCYQPWDFARPAVTHVSVQTKTLNRVAEWLEKYHKPVVVDECCYEGNLQTPWGNLSAAEMTSRFWKAVVTGGYCTHGETFLDPGRDILWWAKGGALHGQSPARIAFLRQIAESLPGPIENVPDHFAAACKPENRERVKAKVAYLPKDLQGMFKAVFAADPRELAFVFEGDMLYQGKVGESVFLTYYDIHCPAEDTLSLPESGSYTVEVIDTWAMTRTVAARGVRGRVTISLPGKEGIATLAIKE